eukprot:jgi/Psemu1/282061/fgenesh1_pg.2_\
MLEGVLLQLIPKGIAPAMGRGSIRSSGGRRCVRRRLHWDRSVFGMRSRARPVPDEWCVERGLAASRNRNVHVHAHVAAGVADRTNTGHGNGKRHNHSHSHTRTNRLLIVGGGPTGLFMAHLLRSYGVPFRLVEAQTPDRRFEHPQAHFLNTRTMEILKHGLSHCHSHNHNHNNNNNNDRHREPNQPNDVYRNIRAAMPPVDEWKSFRFGPDMTCSAENDTIMAEVVHPVDRPLVAMADANGILVPSESESSADIYGTNGEYGRNNLGIPLSPESVGHLAQHTFCRILHDALVRQVGTPDHDVLYGCRATAFDWNADTRLWTVRTDRGEVFDDIDAIVAADGAASSIRTNLFPGNGNNNSGDSTMVGTPTLQRLINVHFTTPEETPSGEDPKKQQQTRNIPPAMLYTVFNSEVLAMCVRHGPGEYVLQIPYFEPYQTPEDDFGIEQVRTMVRSILGNSSDFTIRSIRPWTMGSLVARKYHSYHNVFLAGDAAHVFPPAGGFGMNTGLQDVYSLAWRIAVQRQGEQSLPERPSNDEKNNASLPSLATVGHLYERDRQPVARQNAALSVRNYNRVLNVMRACYLDDRHPAILIQALDATASFVPLGVRQNTFRTLLKTALSPLSQLRTSPNGVYARTIKHNLRSLLGAGQGLPLLFPRHELDFSYGASSSNNNNGGSTDGEEDWSRDSVSSSPRLAVGALFPHIAASIHCESLRRFPRMQPIEETRDHKKGNDHRSITVATGESPRTVSTRDLAAQLATDETPLWNDIDGLNRSDDDGATDVAVCTMYVDWHHWEAMNLIPGTNDSNPNLKMFVVIRPDGHVAAISSTGSHADNLVEGILSVLTT